MRKILLILAFIFLGVSCSGSGKGTLWRIGVDPEWYPNDFGDQTAYVNGFTEELLLQIAQYQGIEFEKIPASWDNLFEGLKGKKYDAVLSSLPPYEYNRAKYDFSESYLEIGPVLVVPVNAQHTELAKMGGELVGLIAGDQAVLILQKYPDVIVRNYFSVPELFDAILNGEIEGAILNKLPAVRYVNDLYAGKLKIAGSPLNDAGLHLIVLKGKHPLLLNAFNKSLNRMKKKKALQELEKKWGLESN